MRARIAVAAVLGVLGGVCGVAAGAAPGTAPDPRRVIVRVDGVPPLLGPELAGASVLWVDGRGTQVFTARRGAPRRLWRAPRVQAPTVAEAGAGSSLRVVQRVDALGASVRRAAFIRTASAVIEPACVRAIPPCRVPSRVVQFAGEVWSGPARGPFRVYAHRVRRSCPGGRVATSLDVSGGDLVFADALACLREGAPRRDRVVLATARGHQVVAAPAAGTVIASVRFASPYVAWSESTSESGAAVVVYDVRTRRVRYRLPLPSRRVAALDVDSGGRVAVLLDRGGSCVPTFDVATATPQAPRLRPVAASAAAAAAVRIAGGRLAFLGGAGCRPNTLRPIVLAGRRERVHGVPAGWTAGGFDVDASRIAYSATSQLPIRDPRLRRRTNIYVVPFAG